MKPDCMTSWISALQISHMLSAAQAVSDQVSAPVLSKSHDSLRLGSAQTPGKLHPLHSQESVRCRLGSIKHLGAGSGKINYSA